MALFSNEKRENIFIQLLRKQAEVLQRGALALERFIAENRDEDADALENIEKEGDEFRRILIDELHKTFVTPFDREDIFELSLYLDDVLDYCYTTVLEMRLLGVTNDKYLQEMATRVREASDELLLSMQRLEKNPLVALDHSRRAKHRENQVEKLYRQAVTNLFHGPEDVHHVMMMLRTREVYRHISNAADQADQAANVIGKVVMKLT
jgi:predicted phosphate transport protein (TIGR00153 family)